MVGGPTYPPSLRGGGMLYFEGNLASRVFAMEWRVCPRFPAFEVSEYGDLRRVSSRPTKRINTRLKGSVDADGYLRYLLRDATGARLTASAHVLVAEAFIGPRPTDEHEVAHNSGSRVSCYYGNLRWALPIENHADMNTHGTARKGENNGRAKITEDDVRFIRREYRRVKLLRVRGGLSALEARFDLDR